MTRSTRWRDLTFVKSLLMSVMFVHVGCCSLQIRSGEMWLSFFVFSFIESTIDARGQEIPVKLFTAALN